ncbi:MerR family transcriptional regulator [Dysgonomonas massiliensis]|uniref:MerR family transcriptional regulator n=1 Tax=Dysgonomonas massiliensis TaxID=2040292 RepID=UPI000C75DF83|nr:MerR family transcriptional regulator [Dysgonomonas massiliensis]
MAIDLENSKKLYFSIKEVAEHFDVNESLLRFWEKEFDTINPRKTAGGSRQYSRQDIEDISLVYHLVREKGLTLEGARQMLKHKKDEATRKLDVIQRLERIRDELKSMEDEFDIE